MSQAAPSISRHELEAKIVKRCWENDAFRKEFLSDPLGCFVKYLNAPKAKLPKITVHEEQPGSWHIVLPAKTAKLGELTDEELERVAGGTGFTFPADGTLLPGSASVTVASGVGGGGSGGW